MEIVATTNDGALIRATNNEIKEILDAVTGKDPKREIKIGQKIPAIDYAKTITEIQDLENDYSWNRLIQYCEEFNKKIQDLKAAVSNSANVLT